METEMSDENETIGQWKTVGGTEAERSARAGWNAAETVGEMETMGGDGRVLLAGRYRVVKRLGEGGMGSVWLAEDGKLDGRKVAVKMLPSVLAGKKGAYRQVKAEALMAMKLSHPNIATVRAFEEDEGGNPFLVMDYIEGEGLDDILAEKGPLGEEETMRLLGPVAAALDYAHLQGVVHRDVKPGNVMVRKDGTPFVLDFGIAREIQETMTRVTGKLSSGTLLYMSPEQLNGAAPKAAQDVYSFAAMAYECLSGHAPFFRGAIEDQIKHKTPEALPEGVGEVLRSGVMAGLAKEPEGRPGSCAGVLGKGTMKKGENRRVDTERRAIGKRKGRGWGWVAALLLTAGVGTGWWWWKEDLSRRRQEAEIQRAADEAARQAEKERLKAEEKRLTVKKAEEERQRAEEEERERRERAAVEEAAYQAAATAKWKSSALSEAGCERGQGFGEKLDEMQQKVQQGEAALQGRNFEKAREWFKESLAAAGWLETNAPLREAAKKAREGAEEAKERAEKVDGAHWGAQAWRQAEGKRAAAETAYEGARFGEASVAWGLAGRGYGAAERTAVAAKVAQGLEAVRGAKGRGSWEECLEAAEGVLALESGNAEAKGLAEEAQRELDEAKKAVRRKEASRRAAEKGKAKAAAAKSAGPATKVVDLGGGVTLEMVACPGVGKDFWMGKYEVTQEQWRQVTGKNPSMSTDKDGWFSFKDRPKNPVEWVSWNDCQKFVQKLNGLAGARASGLTFRLPTVEEWETACRAGAPKGEKYCKLADGTQITEANLSRVAHFGHKLGDGPSSVGGGREPNAWGLYDMHGNVWEWTGTARRFEAVCCGGSYWGDSFLGAAGSCTADSALRTVSSRAERDLGLRLAAFGRGATE
jgi:formylglycine-generating enzyme required for sulfatase activity